MNPITHALTGWSLASCQSSLAPRERAWVVAAALAPDLDGLGIVVELATRNTAEPLYWWSEYHHVLGHNLLFAVLLAGAAWAFTRRWIVTALVFAAVHVHLLCDLLGDAEGAVQSIATLSCPEEPHLVTNNPAPSQDILASSQRSCRCRQETLRRHKEANVVTKLPTSSQRSRSRHKTNSFVTTKPHVVSKEPTSSQRSRRRHKGT